jgi:hypothetical protein
MSQSPVAKIGPYDSHCRQVGGGNYRWCEQLGSCMQEGAFRKKCPDAPYRSIPELPGLGACLADSLEFCSNFSMPEEVRSCQNGAYYSNLSKTVVSDEVVQSMTLFPGAFLTGMQRAKGCHEGVMPYH